MSTLTTLLTDAFMHSITFLYSPSISLDSPIPNRASTITVYSSKNDACMSPLKKHIGMFRYLARLSCTLNSSVACSISPTRNIKHSYPSSASIRAAAIPSAPLLPMEHTNAIRLPPSACIIFSICPTAFNAALSMRTSDSMPLSME